MYHDMDGHVKKIVDDVSEIKTLPKSISAFVSGIGEQIWKAVTNMTENGATPAQTQRLTDLAIAVNASGQSLSQAVKTNIKKEEAA